MSSKASRTRRRAGRRLRRGVVLAEAGIVYSLAILLVLGTLVVGLGIFRYQEVAHLAGEGARWASIRGATFQAERGAAAPTVQDVIDGAVIPRAMLLRRANVTATLTWDNISTPKTVSFTLNYHWTPGIFLVPIVLQCTATQPVSY